MRNKGFTLIEILISIGVLGLLMSMVVSIMTMSFKAKNITESNGLLSSKAVFILGEIKNNILDAQKHTIICPASSGAGDSISFETKNGGMTTLLCDEVSGQIASVSAQGTYNFLESDIKPINCTNFVWCNMTGESEVSSIGISLILVSNDSGRTGVYWETVAPRE
ncbi:MAG: type II secretion system protein [Candidatus Shapirobacteria bacterium]